ncbi:flagellar hook-length control protein FliK [Helicobacter canadensis]|uniref:Flagellar hook-length control protein-like C-terminal domain-containing protein n=1 Tax=Helicobacter canadensis MIT 98-5491 TaxID=537970 RepID=C5ZX75_9HELI|nr:flagellar hook-length control protein FliK [Helicobacter canadensis]EES89743.1 conserved hypothetical protein [Helicobacter canadensis MIT 98-5491]EFR48537.1 flagellar hook-length control protein [Helicobacter canadensis MIT 98-5491]STO99781.1 flagellar hook-length control protein [Helicobacter canadensis]
MIPIIETEKNNQTNLLSKHSKGEEGKGDFAELFGLLTQNTQEIESPHNKISKTTNKKESKESLNLESKENLDLKTDLKMNKKNDKNGDFSFNINQESNLKNEEKKSLKTTQILNPKNPKELLEFTKAQNIQSSTKTLKDITQIANKLQLNLQKISIIKDEAQKEISIKNITNQQETQILQKSTKTLSNKQADNLLNMILQDKELLSKASKKSESNQNLKNKEILESKDIPLTKIQNSKIAKMGDEILEKEISSKTSKKLETKETNQALNTKETLKKDNIKPEIKNSHKFKENEIPVSSNKTDNPSKTLETKEMPIKDNIKQENIINIKKENLKEEMKDKNQIKNFSQKTITEEKQTQEIRSEIKKENSSAQDKQTKNKKDPFSKKTTKESLETISIKQQKKTTQDLNNKDILMKEEVKQENVSSLNANLTNISNEESQKSQNFLENLLKIEIPQKTKNIKYEDLEKETKEKKTNKTHQEIYQSSVQNQNNLLLSPRETFAHFSDKLREALQNYKPPITKISLELNPESLGSVELTITKIGDKINVQIGSNQNALQLFMQNMQDFKNQLNNVGFSEVTMDFKDTGGNSFSQNNGGNFSDSRQQNSHQQQKRNENGLQIYQQAEETNREISHLDLSFSYYA